MANSPMRLFLFAALPLLVAGCGASEKENQGGLGGDSLELAAQERGLIGDEGSPPAGIFERRSGKGRDRLCVVSRADGGWRFAAEFMTQGHSQGQRASQGQGSLRGLGSLQGQGRCLTSGQLTWSQTENQDAPQPRQSWKLQFRGQEACQIDAMSEGDVLIFPDHLPAACANICAGRVNLTGAELERSSWAETEALALRLRGADGSIWTECGQKKAK